MEFETERQQNIPKVVTRIIDQKGRLTIPASMRAELGLEKSKKPQKSLIKMKVENGRIIIERDSVRCNLCGATEDIIRYKSLTVCKDCVDKINLKIDKLIDK